MKSAEEILKEECGESYYLFPHQFSKKDIIEFMEKYADQFRNPPKKTIEERKQEFVREIESIGISCTSGINLFEFIGYWTEHNKNGKIMRFEMKKNQPFNIARRLNTWKTNQKNWKKDGKQSADEAIRDLLSN